MIDINNFKKSIRGELYKYNFIHYKKYLDQHLNRYAETIKLIPNEKRLSVLDIGTFIPLALYLGKTTMHNYTYHGGPSKKKENVVIEKKNYTLHNFNVEKEIFPYKNGTFDMVLCLEVIEHLGKDPMFMLSEINRVLKKKGLLLLTTPNIISFRSILKIIVGISPYLYPYFTLTSDRHNREYSPREIKKLLTISGFTIEKIYTRNVYFESTKIGALPFFPREILKIFFAIGNLLFKYRGDCIFVLARKKGIVKERYPKDFYAF